MAKWTARTSGCKRGPLSFSTRDLALKRSKNNRLWTFRFSVRLWHLCCGAADWPLIFHDFVDGCASSDAECDENIEGTSIFLRPCSRWSWISVGTVEDSPRHCLPLWWKAECQAQRLKVVHLIQIFGHWRNIAKYIGLENTTLERFSWRVQSDSDGGPPPYLENKKCVSTSHMRRDASWMHRDTRHIHS